MSLAIIGGSGLDTLPGLHVVTEYAVDTAWGAPSDLIIEGEYEDRSVLFLARHGREHQLPPHRINYRANIAALKQCGAEAIVAFATVGGISPVMSPRRLVVPHQLIDYTHGREGSFFTGEDAPVTHIDFTHPYSDALRARLLKAGVDAGIDLLPMAVYGITQGPRLETAAEIARMARDGCDLVGMTGMPEAALARELELPYACCALVANWAAGCGAAETITMAEIEGHVSAGQGDILRLLSFLI